MSNDCPVEETVSRFKELLRRTPNNFYIGFLMGHSFNLESLLMYAKKSIGGDSLPVYETPITEKQADIAFFLEKIHGEVISSPSESGIVIVKGFENRIEWLLKSQNEDKTGYMASRAAHDFCQGVAENSKLRGLYGDSGKKLIILTPFGDRRGEEVLPTGDCFNIRCRFFETSSEGRLGFRYGEPFKLNVCHPG
ncbi:hypothetical protein HYU13_05830 [Candidatus Woesearchaeota archaeon]|nr:hypothetical protein [Candidatus Woesearchaeota archaeon]